MKSTTLRVLRRTNHKLAKAFSLVELLVVIAVIAVIAAIAIPNITNMTGAASESSARRNAQNLASLSSSAAAAGITNASVSAWVTALSNGIPATVGGQTVNFKADGLSGTNYLQYLGFTNGVLVYQQ